MDVNPLHYQEKGNGNVELLGEYRTEDNQAECLTDQMLANTLGWKVE